MSRIMQLRAFAATRDAMKSDKQRESDARFATTRSPMAQLVAKVQYMNQHHIDPADMEEE